MKADVRGTQIELEPNSSPYLLKRLLADGFDTVLIFLLFTALTMLLMRTPLAESYQTHFERYKALESAAFSASGGDAEATSLALSESEEYQNERLAANLHAYLLKAAACLIAELPVLLAFPLLRKDRATPGKSMTGIMPFSVRRQSPAGRVQILTRFLFVFFIDSLGLYLVTGVLTFLLVPVLRLIELLLNKTTQRTICDLLTDVTIIEKLSYDGIKSIQEAKR